MCEHGVGRDSNMNSKPRWDVSGVGRGVQRGSAKESETVSHFHVRPSDWFSSGCCNCDPLEAKVERAYVMGGNQAGTG